MVGYALAAVAAPDQVRADLDRLRHECFGQEDILRQFPNAYVWHYAAAGDWGAYYGQSLVIRLTDNLALSFSESFIYDDREYSWDVEIQWLHPETKTYTVVAFWTNDRPHGSPCQEGWEEVIGNYQPMQIADDWVNCMDPWKRKWDLFTYGGLQMRNDSVFKDSAY